MGIIHDDDDDGDGDGDGDGDDFGQPRVALPEGQMEARRKMGPPAATWDLVENSPFDAQLVLWKNMSHRNMLNMSHKMAMLRRKPKRANFEDVSPKVIGVSLISAHPR